MNITSTIVQPVRRQRGVVLITALLVLVIMTIIGLASINTTILQSKMTGNLREINTAFQAAEAGLQAGLVYIEKNFAPPMGDSDSNVYPGCTVGATGSEADCTDIDDVLDNWACPASPTSGIEYGSSGFGADALGGVKDQPRIMIDERQVRTDMEVGAPTYYYYTISAVGTGATGQARSILQSTIVKQTR